MKNIIILVALIVICNNIFPQTMVVKKADGSYMEISISTDVELGFYLPCPGTATVSYEDKTYNTVQIGNQCWFRENLDVGTRINGSQSQSNNSIIEKYCYSDDTSNCNTYGGLYQWNEAMQYINNAGAKGICPSGWRIPTRGDFVTLSSTVGGDGNSLIAIGQGSGSEVGTNTSGFSALLAGYRSYYGNFDHQGFSAVWSSTEFANVHAYYMHLWPNESLIGFFLYEKELGFGVRCLKD